MASIYPNRKDGKIVSFKFKVFLGRDAKGKQIFKCKTWVPDKFSTESKLMQQAEKESVIWEYEVTKEYEQEKKSVAPQEITLADFTEKIWFPSQMNEKDHRCSTIAFRRYLLKVILAYMGTKKLSDINGITIEQYFDYLKHEYKAPNDTKVSGQTMRHHYCTLNLILSYAQKIGYIESNPVKLVETPKLNRHKVDVLSKGEILVFIKEIEKLPLMQQTIYSLLLTTGIRRGECYGLQWGDIDLEDGLIHINRNVTRTDYGIVVGLPKTDTSIRVIPITNNMKSLLLKFKSEQEKKYKIDHSAFLFPNAQSSYEPHDPTYITKLMKKFMKRIGLPDMSPHDLRHTCASVLIESGADVKSVQDILGHANASTTLNFYVKSNIENMRLSAQRAFEM